jgi:hypothetical protein
MSFDWQTGEREWETVATDATDDRQPGNQRLPAAAAEKSMRWLHLRAHWRRVVVLAGMAVVLVGGLAAGIVRQVNQRIAVAVAAAESEVLASHQTIAQAAADRDVELFTFLLSGRDEEWLQSQEELLDSGQFYDRSASGFSWLPATEERDVEAVVSISIDPRLQRAEVVANERYVVGMSATHTETVTLQHTAVYRRGPDRWLYARPEPDFWGESELARGRIISMTFPTRDKEVARRLHSDLDTLLGRLCATQGGACPPSLSVELTLSTNPSSLADLDDPLARWTAGLDVTLPTVTLIGRPVDEPGYQVLFRDYASRLVTSTLTELTGWTCCAHSLYYGTFLAAQLHALGLRPWPDTSAYYRTLESDPELYSQDMQAFWRGGGVDPAPENVMPAYALVEFLIREGAVISLFDIQRTLVRNPGLPFWSWIQEVTGGRYQTLNDFYRALLGYALERAPVHSAVPPPEDDLQLVCSSTPRNDQPALYRYDPATGVLDHERELGSTAFLGGLPDNQGVLAATLPTTQMDGDTFIWRDGRTTPVSFSAINRSAALLPLPLNAPENTIPLLVWDAGALPYALLPLDQCAGRGECDAQPLLGRAVWSPDASRSLLTVGDPPPVNGPLTGGRRTALILAADSEGREARSLEVGTASFWLDDATFGYVLPYASDVGQEIIIRRLNSRDGLPGASRRLLTTQDLQAAIPVQNGAGLHIDEVLVSPAYSEQMFIATTDLLGFIAQSYLLAYDRNRKTITVRHMLADEPLPHQRGYRLSPDGRWLLITSLLQPAVSGVYEPIWRLYLHDIPNNVTREFDVIIRTGDWPAHWFVDWSADGRWLSIVSNGYLRLIPLDSEPSSEWPVVLSDKLCTSAVWVSE